MRKLLCVVIVCITHQTSIVFAQCGQASNIIQDVYAGTITEGSTPINIGQSFTASCSGNIEAITVKPGNVVGGDIMLTLYDGVNPNNPMDSVIFSISSQNAMNDLIITLPSPVYLINGNEYTFNFRNITGFCGYYAMDTDPYVGGEVKIEVLGTNVFGNFENADLYFQIHYQDNVPPVAVCENITVELDESGTAIFSPSLVGSGSSDDSGFFTLSLDTTFTCSDLGANPVLLTVIDSSGNSATCNAIITVVDLLAPVITCPIIQDTTLMVGENYFIPDFISTGIVSITDNCSTMMSNIIQTPPAGNQLSSGINVVSIYAEDQFGNSDTCYFNINVGPLSVLDLQFSGIEIYPNPAIDWLTIKNPKGHNLNEVSLYDIIGNLLFTIKLNDIKTEQQIDLSQLNTGIYFVVVKSFDQQFIQQLYRN